MAAKKKVRTLRCPTCRKIVLRDEPDFPFCSERCRLIDLGKWASGGYVVSTAIKDPDALGGAETQPARFERSQTKPNGGAHEDDDSRKH